MSQTIIPRSDTENKFARIESGSKPCFFCGISTYDSKQKCAVCQVKGVGWQHREEAS